MNLSCQGKRDGLALEIVRSKTKTSVALKDGQVKVSIGVSAEGSIAEVKCGIALDNLSTLYKIEQEWGAKTKADMTAAIRSAQAVKSDIFGFGEVLQRSHPKAWRGVQDRWEELFAEAEVNIVFEGQILRAGMRSKSLMDKS